MKRKPKTGGEKTMYTLEEIIKKIDDEYLAYKKEEDAAGAWDRGFGSGGAQALMWCRNLLIRSNLARGHFPIPVKHDKATVYDEKTPTKVMFAKIMEEVMEAHNEAVYGDAENLAEELQDIIHVCTTYQKILGFNFKARQELCKEVNEKNSLRGYFFGLGG